jgi:HrpA-like RNA helicase
VIVEQRGKLPVTMEEQQIVETISQHDVVVLTGETGSGKSTQVPQFLYEAAYGHPQSAHPGRVAITQPRRVAAMSVSKRVAAELNVPFGSHVGYQVCRWMAPTSLLYWNLLVCGYLFDSVDLLQSVVTFSVCLDRFGQ